MEQTKTHIKYLYPQVAAALEEVIMADKKKYDSVIKMYRGYVVSGAKNGRRMRLSLDKALEVLSDAGYEIEINVVTKEQVRQRKATPLQPPLPSETRL